MNTSISRSVIAVNASGASTSTLVTVFTQAHPVGLPTAQTITSNSITIAWDPNGNPSFTKYVATILPSGRQLTVTSPSATFDGLTGATTYFFSVQAFNGNGVLAPGGGTAGSASFATLPQTESSGQICPAGAMTIGLSNAGPMGW